MAIIDVRRADRGSSFPLRLHTAAIAYHYASAGGVGVRLLDGATIQLQTTIEDFEQLLDPTWKPPKASKPAKAAPAPDPQLAIEPPETPPAKAADA